ncbi:hypothetical protein B0H16DRAFT_1724207 [Mycena metata]|uniref:Uncharacterized protein n=1 Tax=Mycena metata TaxID=1033252 RepID=A0AAD7N8A8_9AGAR|nr:hypothetical protein B0H16DRAFT_1724207 [Mycena metata]
MYLFGDTQRALYTPSAFSASKPAEIFVKVQRTSTVRRPLMIVCTYEAPNKGKMQYDGSYRSSLDSGPYRSSLDDAPPPYTKTEVHSTLKGNTPFSTTSRTPPSYPGARRNTYHVLQTKIVRDTTANELQEFVDMCIEFPDTPHALIGFSNESNIDSPQQLQMMDHYNSPFEVGKTVYCHGAISGIWEIGEVKGNNLKQNTYTVQLVNRVRPSLVDVEMDRGAIRQT